MQFCCTDGANGKFKEVEIQYSEDGSAFTPLADNLTISRVVKCIVTAGNYVGGSIIVTRYRIHQLFEESSVSRIRYAVRTLARGKTHRSISSSLIVVKTVFPSGV